MKKSKQSTDISTNHSNPANRVLSGEFAASLDNDENSKSKDRSTNRDRNESSEAYTINQSITNDAPLLGNGDEDDRNDSDFAI